jgi:hypothetical protein
MNYDHTLLSGMTQAVIPTLVKQGIYGITVGVNGASAPPAVPKIFNWEFNGQRVIAMWHPRKSDITLELVVRE